MSSKKQRRREEKAARKQAAARAKINPAWIFILGIALVLAVVLGGVAVFGERSGPGDPPWPGAVWSQSHGHWH